MITVQADVNIPDPPAQGRAIGLDIGLENFLTTSNQYTVESPHFFKDLQSKLKLLQGSKKGIIFVQNAVMKQQEIMLLHK